MQALNSVVRGMLNVDEAAAELGLRPATIRAWLLRRKIGCVRLSARCVRIPRAEVERLIRENTVTAREVRP
jgi:excisionase family DNA binding protein